MIVNLPYPKEAFNCPELILGDFKEVLPLSPILPGLVDCLVDFDAPAEITIGYIDNTGDDPVVDESRSCTVYPTECDNQTLIAEMCKCEQVSNGGWEKVNRDYYQLPYSDAMFYLRYHICSGVKSNRIIPFIKEVNNPQFREWIMESDVNSLSDAVYALLNAVGSDVSVYQ